VWQGPRRRRVVIRRAVLLGGPALDPFRANAQAHPPHGEGGQPAERAGRAEGHAIVGANHTRQAARREAVAKLRGRGLTRRTRQRGYREHVARVQIGDREGIAMVLAAGQAFVGCSRRNTSRSLRAPHSGCCSRNVQIAPTMARGT
jgi:hypothetical protein